MHRFPDKFEIIPAFWGPTTAEKCGVFSDFQYGFRSSWSTAYLLTVVPDRIRRAFNRSGATQAVALDISKAFDRVWHAGLLHKLKSYGISGQIFGLISSFLSNRWLWVVLDGKSSLEYPGIAGVPQGSILGPTLFLLYINGLPDDVICDIAIYADGTILCSKYDQASDLWQLELASELESDLWDTVDWGRKWLVDFNAGKLNWLCLTSLKTLVLLMWKWMGLFSRKNHLLRCWGWLSLLNWIGALTLSLLLKLPPRKLEPWFVLQSFFLLKLLCISINLPYTHAWNTVVMSGLVPLAATRNY